MTLAEIRAQVKDNCTERPGESIDEYSQRRWDNAPRIHYKDLPLSLQKDVRARFTAPIIQKFLQDCYAPLAPIARKHAPHQVAAFEESNGITADSYLSFDSMTAGIPLEALEKILIRTRNTAVYTIECEGAQQTADGQEELLIAPMLYGDHACAAFEAAMSDFTEKTQQAQEDKAQPKKSAAASKGSTLVSAGFYQFVVSDPQYQFALTTKRNNNAYLSLMTPDFLEHLDFENGTMTYDNQTAGIIKQYSKGKYTDVQNLDLPLLTQIYTAAIKSHIQSDAYTITVSLPHFFREMGIEVSAGNSQDIMAKLYSFKDCIGIMPKLQIAALLFSVIEIDSKKQTMTFAVPYILRLYEALEEKNHIERTTRQGALIDYQKPYHNQLCHSSIAKERNKTAVELVYLITNGLLQRGYTPDIQTYRKKGAKTQYPDRITYSISFRSLINDAPFLRGRIQSYKSDSDKNRALRRAFERAYELLDEKTDANEWFINLEISRIIPTMTTLDDELTITHDGRNGDYKAKK